ncbi:uncharacterized protein ssa6 [Haematococcus lacustris]|uniref:Uncharacterized protein ssa6 n=1 Tax=Haematococcus lacustris TaxID=44745 RepID=A0A699ZTP9_HAELA|nr:uncharacterized protein ssa6 [Haematococcus lacustris]
MCRTCSETRVITALTASANHKSMHVRAKVASQLDGLMELNSGLARTLLASAPACLDRLFRTAAGFLEEVEGHCQAAVLTLPCHRPQPPA